MALFCILVLQDPPSTLELSPPTWKRVEFPVVASYFLDNLWQIIPEKTDCGKLFLRRQIVASYFLVKKLVASYFLVKKTCGKLFCEWKLITKYSLVKKLWHVNHLAKYLLDENQMTKLTKKYILGWSFD